MPTVRERRAWLHTAPPGYGRVGTAGNQVRRPVSGLRWSRRAGSAGNSRHPVRHHLLVEQIGDGDGLLAVRTAPSKAYPAHEGAAALTALVSDGSGPAGLALVDGQG